MPNTPPRSPKDAFAFSRQTSKALDINIFYYDFKKSKDLNMLISPVSPNFLWIYLHINKTAILPSSSSMAKNGFNLIIKENSRKSPNIAPNYGTSHFKAEFSI